MEQSETPPQEHYSTLGSTLVPKTDLQIKIVHKDTKLKFDDDQYEDYDD